MLAGTIYTTGGSPIMYGTNLANAWQIGASQSFGSVAESFVPAATTHLGQIDLAVEAVSGTGNMVVEIASNSGGVPGTILDSFTVAAPVTAQIVTVQSVSRPILNAGSTYWLVVTDTGTLDLAWLTGPNVRGVDINIGGSWVRSTGSTRGTADVISGAAAAAPEASTPSLLAAGFLAIWLSRRCRR